ncbi:MAG: RdgB/HAM1 family non-canonical purine NTP pyrophosphatase [Limnochordales bacterium]|nr:RdgB/HAM1 family non-canonical purine NTP pyrophosphatase [Limnochordales bacterium]
MYRRLVLASGNRHKVIEIKELIRECLPGLEVVSLQDLAEERRMPPPQIVEDQPTLEGNAIKKARVVAEWSGLPALADDTGLLVDALGGRPGVRSARYAGPNATDAENRRRLLEELAGVPPEARGARFRTVVAVAYSPAEVQTVVGELVGRILQAERGVGFGYEALFEVPELGKTLAELSVTEKNRISHRGRALRAALPLLRRLSGPAAAS